MRILSVAGATSKAGKTLLAEQLIRYCAQAYSPVYAIKFTTTSDLPSPCPRGAPCTVCDLADNFRIVRDPEILRQKGKNTARFFEADATEVIWVIAKRSQLHHAYDHLMTHIPPAALLIMEGSTVTSLCTPDLLFYIFANHIPPQRWKESAAEIVPRADFVLMNRKSRMPDHPLLQIPPGTIVLSLQDTPATELPQIRDRIDQVIRSLDHALHNP